MLSFETPKWVYVHMQQFIWKPLFLLKFAVNFQLPFKRTQKEDTPKD